MKFKQENTFWQIFLHFLIIYVGFPGGTSGVGPTWRCRRHEQRGVHPWVRDPPDNAGDMSRGGSIPAWGRSPGGGHAPSSRQEYLLWYSCLETPCAEEPTGPQSMGSQWVWHDWKDLSHILYMHMLDLNRLLCLFRVKLNFPKNTLSEY